MKSYRQSSLGRSGPDGISIVLISSPGFISVFHRFTFWVLAGKNMPDPIPGPSAFVWSSLWCKSSSSWFHHSTLWLVCYVTSNFQSFTTIISYVYTANNQTCRHTEIGHTEARAITLPCHHQPLFTSLPYFLPVFYISLLYTLSSLWL